MQTARLDYQACAVRNVCPFLAYPMTCTIRCGRTAHLDYRVCARPQRPPYWALATCTIRCVQTARLDYQVCARPQRLPTSGLSALSQ